MIFKVNGSLNATIVIKMSVCNNLLKSIAFFFAFFFLRNRV